MSSQRGNVERTRPSKYKNTFKFVHNKNSRKTKQILESPIEGVCEKCYKILAWKKEYRKYKPLTVPKRCTMCQEKKITRSYTIVCDGCAKKNGICAKCREKKAWVQDFDQAKKEKQEELEKERILASLTERERRRYLMHLERGDFDNEGKSEEDDEKGDKEGDEADSDDESEDGSAEEQKLADKKSPNPTTIKTPPAQAAPKAVASASDAPKPTLKKRHSEGGNCCAFDEDHVDDEDIEETSDAEDEEDDEFDEDDDEDLDELDDDDEEDDEDESEEEERVQVVDTSKPIPGRKIFRGKRTMPEAVTSSPSPSKPETLEDSDDDLEEINKSFDKDEDDEDDPFLAALKTAEEKKKALASPPKGPAVDLSTKYNPKPSELFQSRGDEVDGLAGDVEKLSLGDEDEDNGPVKSFVFKALQ